MTVQHVFTPPAVAQQSSDDITQIHRAVARIRPLVERFQLWNTDPLGGALGQARAILAHPLALATGVAPNRSDTAAGTLAAIAEFAKAAQRALAQLESAVAMYDQAERDQRAQQAAQRAQELATHQAIADQVQLRIDPAPAEALASGRRQLEQARAALATAEQAVADHQGALATAKNVPAHVTRERQLTGEAEAYHILLQQAEQAIAPLEQAARAALVAGWNRFELEWQQAAEARLAEPQAHVDALQAELGTAIAARNAVRNADQAGAQQIAAARQALLR